MLNGWKMIANHIGRDQRTAMRWAAERGLPVHRTPGQGRGSVYASPDEIDNWLAAERDRPAPRPPPPAPSMPEDHRRRARPRRRMAWVAAAAACCLAAAALGGLMSNRAASRHPAEPQRFTDAVAKALYLQATYDWNLRTPDSIARAIRGYGAAIARDPRVAAPYIGLANSYLLVREFGTVPDSEAYPRAQAAAQGALNLAPDSAEAERALAFIAFWWRQDRPAARRAFIRAAALKPDDPLTHHWYATALTANGEDVRALREIERARELDPGSTSILADEGRIAYAAGRRDEGKAILHALTSEQPTSMSAHYQLAMIALNEGRGAEYLDEADAQARLRGDHAAEARLASLRRLAGGTPALLAVMLSQAESATRGAGGRWYAVAELASLAGKRDTAKAALARSCKAREPDAVAGFGNPWLTTSLDRATIAALCGGGRLS